MTRINRIYSLGSVACFLFAAALTAAAADNRPAVVPQNFVITPFGYYHPSCINHLAQGDVLHTDEKAIARANGTREPIPMCGFPHFKADGTRVDGNEPAGQDPPTISHAWVEYASITTSTSYGQIYSEWDVPPNPAKTDGQVVYLFNGMEDASDVVTIIQPVLGWNSDYANAWGIAAWNCCVNGQVNEGTPAKANPGDHLEGYTFMTCAKGTLTCSSWDIVIVDTQNGNFSQLIGTSNYGQTFNWAFGAVLEVYNITKCGDYPAPDYLGGVGFTNQSVLNNNFVSITPAWTVTNASKGLTPQCNYGGSQPKQIVLKY